MFEYLLDIHGISVWMILSFLLAIAVIAWKVWKPIVTMLETKRSKVLLEIEDAKKAKEESDTLLKEQQRLMDEARLEAKNIILRSKERAERIQQEIIQKAEEEALSITNNAQKEVEREKQRVIHEIKTHMVDLSVDLTKQLLSKTLQPEDHRQIIQHALNKYRSI